MIRHLVLWKVKDCASLQKKKETLELLKSLLESLPKAIDGIVEFEVGISSLVSPAGADLSLFSTFASETALAAYIVHPLHCEIVAILTERISTKLICDYSVESTSKN